MVVEACVVMGKVHPGRKSSLASGPNIFAAMEDDQQVGLIIEDGQGSYTVQVVYPFHVASIEQGMELVKLFRHVALQAYTEQVPMGGLPDGGIDCKPC